MTLEELFAVVQDKQEVRLYGDGFEGSFKETFETDLRERGMRSTLNYVEGHKAKLEAVLTERAMRSTVDCVEASFAGELKVWFKDGGERKRRRKEMANKMTTQEAIHIIAEEAVRCRRLADDLAKDPLDQDGRALEHAKGYRRKADAMDRLVKIAWLWNTPVDE